LRLKEDFQRLVSGKYLPVIWYDLLATYELMKNKL